MNPTPLDDRDREFLHALIDRADYVESFSFIFDHAELNDETADRFGAGLKRFIDRRRSGRFTQNAEVMRIPRDHWIETDLTGRVRWSYELGYKVFDNE